MLSVTRPTLSTPAKRLFPLLDPTVGRAVGAYFQYQKNEGQAESLKLVGDLDDGNPETPDAVSLSLQRGKDGTVAVRGTYAGRNVEVDISQNTADKFREKSNLIWGQAGPTTDNNRALMEGRVGDYPLQAWVTTHRQEVDTPYEKELAKDAKAIYVLPFALSVTPTFGGQPAKVNGLPGDVPTPSTPLETTDRTTVQARFGDLEVATTQNWTTTTWTVSTNLRAGGSRVTMMQHERASDSETYQESSEKRTEVRDYEVEPGKGAVGSRRTYELDFANGVVSGDLQADKARLHFELRPG